MVLPTVHCRGRTVSTATVTMATVCTLWCSLTTTSAGCILPLAPETRHRKHTLIRVLSEGPPADLSQLLRYPLQKHRVTLYLIAVSRKCLYN